MAARTGEKLGWIGGWMGAFCWVAGFGIWSFLNGDTHGGTTSLALYAMSGYLVWRVSPWHHEQTRYWKLMLPLYGFFLIAIYLTLRTAGWLGSALENWPAFFGLGALFIPLFLVGGRRWSDGPPAADRRNRSDLSD